MSIWFSEFTLAEINALTKNTLLDTLGIEFTEILDDALVGQMPVDHRTVQPVGILHGGASCVLAESIGSVAANYCVDASQFYCVGLDINTNHLRAVSKGVVHGVARPFHLGRTTQVWGIEIFCENKKRVSVTRLTMAVLSGSKLSHLA